MRYLRSLISVVLLTACLGTAHAGPVEGLASDFTLKSTQGKNIKLSELRGQVVMINFWASWCGPCRQEMPLLEKLYRRYQPVGFTLVGINVDERSADAQRLLKEIPVSFPVLLDNENRISRLYNVDAMPSTVLVDRDGKMRFLHRGYLPGYEAEYEKQIKALLRE